MHIYIIIILQSKIVFYIGVLYFAMVISDYTRRIQIEEDIVEKL